MAGFRVVFMGSPEFALPTFRVLLETEDVVCAVTQPDRPKGRGRLSAPPPVRVEAERAGIPVLQPLRLRDPAAVAEIAAFRPEVIIVVAYGQILPRSLLSVPKLGCINVHASLLPKYRGAAPINWAIMRGEMVTGVSIMRMDAGLDTGDVLLAQATPIGQDETAMELSARLASMGARLLLEALCRLRDHTLFAVPQNNEAATLAPRLTKADGEIDWSASARQVCNRIRGVRPWPGAYTHWGGSRLKVFGCRSLGGEADASPGKVWRLEPEGLIVGTGEGRVAVAELQLQGGRRMPAREFMLGHPMPEGTVLGAAGPPARCRRP
ncbi:MAG: methionyl-tRNA formyltransferase [Pseudomonadota bacterium]